MASTKAVGAALKMLARAFAGIVDEARVELYVAALEDLTDEQLAIATTHVIKTHTGEFIPPPAVIRKAIASAPTTVDASALIRKIEKLAVYSPTCGMIYPQRAIVERELGELAAYAYAAAGGQRLFSENDTTRDIAMREFSRAVLDGASRPGAQLPVIGASAPQQLLESSVQ